jgi:ribosomal protein S18 acetylase RimI-like enzyme
VTDHPGVRLRPGLPTDAAEIARIVDAAYRHYVALIGRPPGPMLADQAAVLARLEVWVAEQDGVPVGLVVLDPQPDHLLLDNVAVDPAFQGRGVGRSLLDHAERRAAELGLPEIRLFTHETMTENQAIYAARGFTETGRRTDHGFRRVFMAKPVGN